MGTGLVSVPAAAAAAFGRPLERPRGSAATDAAIVAAAAAEAAIAVAERECKAPGLHAGEELLLLLLRADHRAEEEERAESSA